MQLTPSAHVDSFCRDNLPSTDTWPELLFDLPDVQYPDRLNCAVELLDRTIEHGAGDRPCLLSPSGERWTYSDLLTVSNQVAHALGRVERWRRGAEFASSPGVPTGFAAQRSGLPTGTINSLQR